MGKFIDLTGKKFNQLSVIERDENKNNSSMWICVCDCGKILSVRGTCLTSGKNKSCGCYRKKHMTTHGNSHKRIYSIWSHMKQRCYDRNSNKFYLYGERGIFVCNEWMHSFETFYNWAIANGYTEKLTIDRINNDKGYSPENCRWETYSNQNKNRRKYNKER